MNGLINRQAALDIFKSWLDVKGYSEGELNMLRAVIYELETMPSTSAWVSVKDRLPEPDMKVLAHSIDGIITHWMPLPTPPKESDAE